MFNLLVILIEVGVVGDLENFFIEYFDNLGKFENLLVEFVLIVLGVGVFNEWIMVLCDSVFGNVIVGEYILIFDDMCGIGGMLLLVGIILGGVYDLVIGLVFVFVDGGLIDISLGMIGEFGGLI